MDFLDKLRGRRAAPRDEAGTTADVATSATQPAAPHAPPGDTSAPPRSETVEPPRQRRNWLQRLRDGLSQRTTTVATAPVVPAPIGGTHGIPRGGPPDDLKAKPPDDQPDSEARALASQARDLQKAADAGDTPPIGALAAETVKQLGSAVALAPRKRSISDVGRRVVRAIRRRQAQESALPTVAGAQEHQREVDRQLALARGQYDAAVAALAAQERPASQETLDGFKTTSTALDDALRRSRDASDAVQHAASAAVLLRHATEAHATQLTSNRRTFVAQGLHYTTETPAEPQTRATQPDAGQKTTPAQDVAGRSQPPGRSAPVDPRDKESAEGRVRRAQARSAARPAAASGTSADGNDTDPVAAARRARTDYALMESQALQVQADNPPGFEPSPAARQFGQGLRLAVLSRPRPTAMPPEALPDVAVVEIASRAIAHVTGGDAARGQQLLQAMGQRSLAERIGEVPDLSAGTGNDVQQLLHLLCALPRGEDVAHVLSRHGGSLLEKSALRATRDFWRADVAQRAETDTEVHPWLSSAKSVLRMQAQGQATDAMPHGARAAANAVRSGLLTNAEGSLYRDVEEQLRTVTVEWIERSPPRQVRPRPFVPDIVTQAAGHVADAASFEHRKTPFSPRGLAMATEVAETVDVVTNRRHADAGTLQAARRLSDWARDSLAHDLQQAGQSRGDTQRMVAATLALADSVEQSEHPGVETLDKDGFAEIRKGVAQRLHIDGHDEHPHLLRKPNPEEPLPAVFESMAGATQPATRLTVIHALMDDLRLKLGEHVPAERGEALQHDEAAQRAATIARRKHVTSAQEVIEFFDPMIETLMLRNQVRVGGGGTLGFGIPSLPYSVASPVVSPVFSAGWSHSEEAYMTMLMRNYAMEMHFGNARTATPEVTVGVAAGPQMPGVARVQGALTGRFSRDSTHSQAAILRLHRVPGQEDALREKMRKVFDSMMRWDQHREPDGRFYKGPLEAVLARNPDVSVGRVDGHVPAFAALVRLYGGAALNLLGESNHDLKLGIYPGLAYNARTGSEKTREKGGHVQQTALDAKGQQHALAAELQVNAGVIVPVGVKQQDTLVAGAGNPAAIDIVHELLRTERRRSVSPFKTGLIRETEIDITRANPKYMLAVIDTYRQELISRATDLKPADTTGNRHTRANYVQAAKELKEFEDQVRTVGRGQGRCEFNVNFMLRQEASARLDALLALHSVALASGDKQTAQAHLKAYDALMRHPASWRPNVLSARENVQEIRLGGFKYGPWVQARIAAKGKRTIAQYPRTAATAVIDRGVKRTGQARTDEARLRKDRGRVR